MAGPLELLLFALSVVLLLSIVASKLSTRLGVPALLLFLLIGVLAGPEGPGGIVLADPGYAQALGVVALAFILFSGGLDTDWRTCRPALGSAISLSTLGVFITCMLVGAFASVVLGFSLLHGILLGAIISSTDAAAVFSVMRTNGIGLKGKIAPLIELESGTNDPMAIFLTISLTSLLMNPAATVPDLIPLFVQQMLIGGIAGYVMGRLIGPIINRVRLHADGLYPVLTVALVLLTYGATASLGGSGFLAVYLAGLVVSERDFIHKNSLSRFHDATAWLMQIVMFLALGLLIVPSRMFEMALTGVFIALFLTLVARPASVYIGLALSGFDLREKAMVSWVGLRGAAPIILATFPLTAGVAGAEDLFDIVFFVVLISVLIQGTAISPVARWLRVDAPLEYRPAYPIEFVSRDGIKGDLTEIIISEQSPIVGQQVVELNLPDDILIVLIARGKEFIVPNGSTVIEPTDRLLVLGESEDLVEFYQIIRPPALRTVPGEIEP